MICNWKHDLYFQNPNHWTKKYQALIDVCTIRLDAHMNCLKINLFLKTGISSASALIPYMHPVPAVLYYIQMALHIPQKYSL